MYAVQGLFDSNNYILLGELPLLLSEYDITEQLSRILLVVLATQVRMLNGLPYSVCDTVTLNWSVIIVIIYYYYYYYYYYYILLLLLLKPAAQAQLGETKLVINCF